MSYEVVKPFIDLEDTTKTFPKGREYGLGDKFPATKRKVSAERIEMLATTKNKHKAIFIKEIQEIEGE